MIDFSSDFIKKLKNKDTNAFEEFYKRTVDIFFRYIRGNYFLTKQEVYDLLSDFYVKIWDNLEKIDENKNFGSWIWTVLKNFLKDYFKKSKDIYFSQLDSENEVFSDFIVDDVDIKEFFSTKFEAEKIQNSIKKLDPISQDILFFRYVEKMDLKEISNILGITYDNARQKHSRAIKKLKKILGA